MNYAFPHLITTAKGNTFRKKKYQLFITLLFFLVAIFTNPLCSFAKDDPGKGCRGVGNKSGGLGGGGNKKDSISKKSNNNDSTEVITPNDPNIIIGLKGFEQKQWTSIKNRLAYTIFYENDPKTASAPAQNVFIRLAIDSKINANTLKLADFGFGSLVFQVPNNTSFYNTRLDVRDSLGLYVDVIAGVDFTKNELFWFLRSIDPATGKTPTDPLKGFLPVNDTNKIVGTLGKGEGFVRFSILPSSNVLTQDSIQAQASIVFDVNEEVLTNTWKNTIDAFPPTSNIHSYQLTSATVHLTFGGQDDNGGTGVKDYALYVSQNNGPFTRFADKISDTSFAFTGTPGSMYKFFTLATDNVGNEEPLKNSSNITVFIPNDRVITNVLCPEENISFSTTVINGASYQWQVDMGNGFIDVSNNQYYEGSTSASLLIKGAPTAWYGHKYRCKVVTNASTIYSPAKTLEFFMSWKGDTNDAWETPQNWSCNKVPDEFTDVLINSAKPVKLNSTAAVRSIILYPGAHLTITSTNNLNVKGKH